MLWACQYFWHVSTGLQADGDTTSSSMGQTVIMIEQFLLRDISCLHSPTLVLQLPGKKGTGPTGWIIQARLQMYFWLGLSKHKKELLKGMPQGYEDTPLLRRALRIVGTPPPSIKYIGMYDKKLAV